MRSHLQKGRPWWWNLIPLENIVPKSSVMASNISKFFPVCVWIFPYTAEIEALFSKQVNISVEATFRFGVGSLKVATVWVWVHRCGTTCFDCLCNVKILNVYCGIQVCSGFENTFNYSLYTSILLMFSTFVWVMPSVSDCPMPYCPLKEEIQYNFDWFGTTRYLTMLFKDFL